MARVGVFIAIAAALSALIYCIGGVQASLPLEQGRAYRIEVLDHQAAFDVDSTSPHSQYLLIVGNLSPDISPRDVQIDIQPIEESQLAPYSPLPELPALSLPKHHATDPAPPTQSAARQRSFWIHVDGSTGNRAGYRCIDAKLKGQGRGVQVYVDSADRVDQETVDEIITLCDQRVFPTTARYLGRPLDVDGDGKFSVLLTSWLGRLDGGRVSLGGMVAPNDFRADLQSPFSNHADVLYLNANVRPGRHLETLLAHELAHAVTTSGAIRSQSLLFEAAPPEAWLNEAISHVAENLNSDNWSNLDYRIAAYLNEPEAVPLVVPDYAAEGMWRKPATRGSTYLFLRWCVEQYGVELLPQLVNSPRRGINKIETVTGEKFTELFRRFTLDLFRSDQQSAENKLPTLDAYNQVGTKTLCGPRLRQLTLGRRSTAQNLNIAGTGAAYFVLSAKTPGAHRVRVRAGQGAALQLTLLPLPKSRPLINVKTQSIAGQGVQLQLAEATGNRVEFSHVICHCQDDETANEDDDTFVWRGDQLADLLPTQQLAGAQRIVSRPLPQLHGPALLRIVGKDAAGRKFATWTQINVKGSSESQKIERVISRAGERERAQRVRLARSR